MNKKHARSLLLAWGLAWWVGWAQAQAQPLRIAVSDGPVSLPLYVAQDQKLFQREGLDVQLLPCSSGRECVALMRAGKADLATAAEFVVAMSALDKADARILAVISQSAYQLKLVARRSLGVATEADLADKRIATVDGSSARYFLDMWLTYHGVEPGRVNVPDVAPDAMADALLQGRAAAVAIWEPAASRIAAQLGADAIKLSAPRVYVQHFCLVAPRPVPAGAAGAVGTAQQEKLLRVLAAAQARIAQEPAQARRSLAAHLQLAEPQAQSLMDEQTYQLALSPSLVSTLHNQVRWATRRPGGVPPKLAVPGLTDVIAAGALRAVAPGAVTYAQ